MMGATMNKVRAVLGITWATLALPLVLVTFVGNGYFSKGLASATGITVTPWYTGGELTQVVGHGTYSTLIHRPVFDGLFGPRTSGFVQVNWEPASGLPTTLEERIDYDRDGNADFLIRLDPSTGEAQLTAYSRAVKGIEQVYRLRNGWAVRVSLVLARSS